MLLALVSACSQDKQEEPKPKEYAVRVRVTGSNMIGGTAIINSTSNYKSAPVEKPVIARVYPAETVNETIDLGTFGAADRIRVEVAMSGVKSEAVIKAEILVDGVVKKSCFVLGGGLFERCELATDTL
ncbi:hypothetical protein BEN49_02725 [Hymenobacter coccineus]|uniref:Uncharacterized protein n=2 Tax=Hymenobacter coccineus TaxID=1908235 RepID=A0A1G1STX7_9BACT|nr:hypothetical protein BEN49_02725 [Hymenobacter coccineus]